jgi:high-affinity K+ transport system ATPase subunit B
LPNTKAPVDKLKELETVMITGPNKITAPLIWTSEKE